DGYDSPHSGQATALTNATGIGVIESQARTLAENTVSGTLQNGARDARAVANGSGPLSLVESHASATSGAAGWVNAFANVGSSAVLPTVANFSSTVENNQGLAFAVSAPSGSVADQITAPSVEAQLPISQTLALGTLGVSFATGAFDAGVHVQL